jgi:hypothetical protein
MRRLRFIVTVVLLALTARLAASQEVIDRVAARVESDIILFSEVRSLASYQLLVDGKSESDSQILDRLINQWIVHNEADTARFPRPSAADVDRGVERLEKSFASPEEYERRKLQAGLSDSQIRGILESQLYLGNYLDSRFRPAVHIEPKDVQDFYDKEIVPRAQARNQAPPSFDAARDYIQEALVQKGIDEQADRWLTESRLRVHVEKFLDGGPK